LARESGALVCGSQACGKRFALDNDVPVLFDERQSLFSPTSVARARAKAGARSDVSARVKATLERVLPTLERNVPAKRNAGRFAHHALAMSATPVVLNIGGKHAGAACASLRTSPSVQLVEMDVRPGPRTNLLADPPAIPFDDGVFEAVIIDAVLEHLPDPERAVSEIWRVLKPGGLVYSDVPFMLQVHGGALDYWRFSHVGHRRLFRGFVEIESGISQGPSVALECAAQYFLLSFVRGKPARYAVRTACRLSFSWLKYVDDWLVRQTGAIDAAMGTFFMGSKTATPLSDRELLDAYRGASPDLHPVR
jgi:SAM-dependent methyltransferase